MAEYAQKTPSRRHTTASTRTATAHTTPLLERQSAHRGLGVLQAAVNASPQVQAIAQRHRVLSQGPRLTQLAALSAAFQNRSGSFATTQRRRPPSAFGLRAALPHRQAVATVVAAPTVQREWSEGGYPQRWDVVIDGVQWFRENDGEIWFEIRDEQAERFGRYAGKEAKRSFEEWDQLELSLDKLTEAKRRIRGYAEAKRTDFKKDKERRTFDTTGGLATIDREVQTPVLVADKENKVARTGWTWAEHEFETPLDAGGTTKFVNEFHLPREDGDVDAVVMMENYRERARAFFASDAFFDQWMRVQKVTSMEDLPRSFPRWVYRNNISNEVLAAKLNALLGGHSQVDVEIGGEAYRTLEGTDNVKSTTNILAEYNNLNALRGEPASRIIAMRIYKGPAIRFEISKG